MTTANLKRERYCSCAADQVAREAAELVIGEGCDDTTHLLELAAALACTVHDGNRTLPTG